MISRSASLEKNNKGNKKRNPQEQTYRKGEDYQENTICCEVNGGKNEVQNFYLKSSTVSDFLFTATHSWNTSLSSVFHRIPLLLLYLSPATCEEGVAGRSETRNSVYRLRAPFTSSRKEIALFSPKGGKVNTVEVLQ